MKNHDIAELYEQRKALILALEQGDLNKERFILENYKLIENIKHVDLSVGSFEEGILKYHYFNTKAKVCMIDADAVEFRDPTASQRLLDDAYNLYQKKERVTLNLLEMTQYRHISAYYIELNSRALSGRVFEIVFEDADRAILHSKDKKVLHKLKSAGCFKEEQRASLIDQYVNTKVY